MGIATQLTFRSQSTPGVIAQVSRASARRAVPAGMAIATGPRPEARP